MNSTCKWFAESYDELNPLLQDLHMRGGQLTGPVSIKIPVGIAGLIGRRVAKKLGIPVKTGAHSLTVGITPCEDGLHWDRCFDEDSYVKSVFKPVGTKSDGYWVESTGAIQLHLTVDIKEGGWYWRCLQARINGIKIPLWLLPRTTAYKIIENKSYRFYVGFSLPLLGHILSYSGLLNMHANNDGYAHEDTINRR